MCSLRRRFAPTGRWPHVARPRPDRPSTVAPQLQYRAAGAARRRATAADALAVGHHVCPLGTVGGVTDVAAASRPARRQVPARRGRAPLRPTITVDPSCPATPSGSAPRTTRCARPDRSMIFGMEQSAVSQQLRLLRHLGWSTVDARAAASSTRSTTTTSPTPWTRRCITPSTSAWVPPTGAPRRTDLHRAGRRATSRRCPVDGGLASPARREHCERARNYHLLSAYGCR